MRVAARCIGHTYDVLKVGISGDGMRVFSFDGTVRQWDVESGEELKDKRLHLFGEKRAKYEDDWIERSAFSPENSFVVADSWWGAINVWDLRTGERVGLKINAPKRVVYLTLSPNGRIVAAGLRTGSLLLFDVQTARPVCGELKSLTQRASRIAVSADGRLVASWAWDGTVQLWDIENKTQLGDPLPLLEHRYKENVCVTYGIALSEGSKQILSAHFDGSVSVCDAAKGVKVRSWQAHAGRVNCMAVTGDLGSRLAVSGSDDGTVRVWDLQMMSSTPNEEKERDCYENHFFCVAACRRTVYEDEANYGYIREAVT